MLERIKVWKNDKFLMGSLVLIFMIGIYNFLNYVFQISMASLLSPENYGIFAVLMSIIYIFSISSEAIQTVISKYANKLNIKREQGKIKDLLLRSLSKALIASSILFLGFCIFSIFLAKWLNIDFYLLAITGMIIFGLFILPIIRGILQGRKKFISLGFSMIAESIIKIVLSVSLVLLGLKVYGAIAAVVITFAIAVVLSLFFIKDILSSKRKRENFKGIYRYSIPGWIAITSIVLMYSLDILLARKFFSADIVGQYAFVSLIGKAILFVNMAVGKVMFPFTSEKFERGKDTKSLLKKSLIITLVTSGVALIFFFFMPETIIRLISLGSTKYLGASGILFLVGLTFSFTSVSNILILYNLSINKIKSSFFLLSFVIIEAVLLSLFNSNIMEFAISLVISSFLMLCYSLVITLKKNNDTRRRK